MKKSILFLFIISLTSTSIAQDGSFTPPKHFVGLHVGSTTGSGISYRYWPTKFGGEITAFPRFEKGGYYNINTGLSLLFKLKENKRYTIYTYFGNSLLIRKFDHWEPLEEWNPNNPNPEYIITTKKSTQFNSSIGLGYKVNFLQNLDFNLQAGYGFYDITSSVYTSITGEISMYYHF